jgi:hypothetical protein
MQPGFKKLLSSLLSFSLPFGHIHSIRTNSSLQVSGGLVAARGEPGRVQQNPNLLTQDKKFKAIRRRALHKTIESAHD